MRASDSDEVPLLTGAGHKVDERCRKGGGRCWREPYRKTGSMLDAPVSALAKALANLGLPLPLGRECVFSASDSAAESPPGAGPKLRDAQRVADNARQWRSVCDLGPPPSPIPMAPAYSGTLRSDCGRSQIEAPARRRNCATGLLPSAGRPAGRPCDMQPT